MAYRCLLSRLIEALLTQRRSSIKGHLVVKGKDAGAGCSILAWAGKKTFQEDAPWVGVLRTAGAVFYCRTTIVRPSALARHD
jgi:Asp-tRNA(Asn)/Glu-tRNA(Gln) amidotransferase A subunit family amidase